MNSESLTPTHAKSHAPAKHLLQAKASLKTLISYKDLEFLIEYDDKPPQWAIGASQKNNLQDRFLSSLSISDWDVDAFVELLIEKASTGARWLRDYSGMVQGPDDEFMNWLSDKPIQWHQQMYALLHADFLVGPQYKRRQSIERLKPLRIVRLSNGKYSIGSKCFFPSDGIDNDEFLPRIDKDIFSSGKSKIRRENARKFLEEIGVDEVGEADQIRAILKQRYNDDTKTLEEKIYREDLNRFIALVKKGPDSAKLFADYCIFESIDGKRGKPIQVYLDLPFEDTGIGALFRCSKIPLVKQMSPISKKYEKVNGFKNFAKDVGVMHTLEIREHNATKMQEHVFPVKGNKTATTIDRDYYINGLNGEGPIGTLKAQITT